MDDVGTALIRTRQASLRGISPGTRGSKLAKLRHGFYLPREDLAASGPDRRYGLLVRATVEVMKVPAPLAHESAAVLLGIPIIGNWPEVTHVLEDTVGGGRGSTHLMRHGTRFPAETVVVDGITVTSATRTVIDLARTRPFPSGLASADHSLRQGLTTPEMLAAEVDRLGGTRGIKLARAVVEHADGRPESVGESLSRAQMIILGLPLPQLQPEFHDADGYIGRSDFWWSELRLIGEFDGYVKFGRDLAATVEDARAALWAEKQREDRLRRTGNSMLRWTWQQAHRLGVFARLMASAGIVPDRPPLSLPRGRA